jgi:DNA-binding response OmpR family regulator
MPPDRPKIVLVASNDDPDRVDEIVARLRRAGVAAYAAHSSGGCLRVATSIGPDLVLLDPSLPKRVERLLRAHPTSAKARILRLSEDSLREASPSLGPVAPAPA